MLGSVLGWTQRASSPRGVEDKHMLERNEFFAKGGMGIIRPDFYVVLKSAQNELLLRAGEKWTGLGANKRQVVILSEGRIWSREDLPEQFDLSKAIVVSFEGDRVRFFDFEKMTGGYYRRPR
jgi:hypothetical protein